MALATFSVRMDESLKRQFDALCSEFGMNATTAFNVFARAVVREKRIPFEIQASSNFCLLYTSQLVRRDRHHRVSCEPRHHNNRCHDIGSGSFAHIPKHLSEQISYHVISSADTGAGFTSTRSMRPSRI